MIVLRPLAQDLALARLTHAGERWLEGRAAGVDRGDQVDHAMRAYRRAERRARKKAKRKP